MKEERKKRSLLLLLLLLFFLIGGIWYYISGKRNNNELVVNHPINRNKTTGTLPQPVDSNLVADSSNNTAALQPRKLTNADTIEDYSVSATVTYPTKKSETPASTDNETTEGVNNDEAASQVFKKKGLNNISSDDGILCYYDPVKKNLFFSPRIHDWSKVYLIYPSPDAKSLLRRNLIYPDYPGVIYPVYRKGKISYKGNTRDAVAVKINARAGSSKSYIIQTKSNPDYFIFGDFEDKDRWYIFENGKVSKFVPPAGFDAGLTGKLN